MPLGKRADYGDARFAGLEVAHATDVVETLQVINPMPEYQLSVEHNCHIITAAPSSMA
jgi:hypothetical protein